ncbi:MAG: hypothetical protein KGY60_08300 [Bacteroidales bacterium]|nr:hypothetical protein [Bacteroidales bacterium]
MKFFKLLFTLVLLISFYDASGQGNMQYDPSVGNDNKNIYRVWVIWDDNTPPIEGYLNQLKSSSVVVKTLPGSAEMNPSIVELRIHRVEVLKFRREGKVSKGALTGAFAGFLAGFIVGASSSDFMPATAGLLVGGAGAATGSIIGTIVGSFRISVPIRGNQRMYQKRMDELKKYQSYDTH